jgi:putative transposase
LFLSSTFANYFGRICNFVIFPTVVLLGLRNSVSSAVPHKGFNVRKHESTTPEPSVATRRLTLKYRIYPTTAQTKFLNGELMEACSLYNCALEERIGAWKLCRKSLSYYDQCKQIKPMRADGCLTLTTYDIAQDVLRRLDKTFNAFFARVKRSDKPGFPRFRSSRRYDSITFPHYGNGCRLLVSGKLRVQGAGHIKVNLHRPLEGTVKTVTIKREAGRWFACFSVEQYKPEPFLSSGESVGIDVGLTTFAAFSNGAKIENPRYYRNAQARLRRCQRKVARRNKGSNRRRKAVQVLQRAHVHVANQRADFHHQEARKIVNCFGFIAVEDLNVKGLAAGMLAKSVHDAGWSQFLGFISYKAEWAGRENPKVDARGTSQECLCGASVPKKLSDRWHSCKACGLEGPRDLISAQVILQRARNLPSSANAGITPSVGRESVC